MEPATEPNAPTGESGKEETKPTTFTQADVDRIVADRLKRERETTKTKYADYDALKAKAAEGKTVEDRMSEVEKRASDAEARALRSEIASEHGISKEDRDLFLTGTDEATLTAQAKRLAERDEQKKKRGNVVPSAGRTPTDPKPDPLRDAARQLFGRDS